MTVRLEAKIHRYIGLSTDERPYPGQIQPDGRELTDADIPVGSSFLAADTEDVWRWDGRGWIAGDNRTVLALKDIKGLLGQILEYMTPSL